jgi:hypothetical protein
MDLAGHFVPEPDSPERFYFDPNSFLLMRESRALPRETPEEDSGQMVIEYGDYKNVDGWCPSLLHKQSQVKCFQHGLKMCSSKFLARTE